MLDAFWRAAAYCLHPQVILLSIAPLVVAGGVAAALGYFYWEAAVDGVRGTLEGWGLLHNVFDWLESIGGGGFRAVFAPLVLVALMVPVIVILSLLLVATLMTPALVRLVAARRFPALERKRGAGLVTSTLWSLGCTLAALVLMIASIPLWFVPPLVLVVPPLIWGWLTYRVLTFDVLADHASTAERRAILREHRWPLFGMGIVTGYLGAAPSLLWAASAAMLIFAPLILVAAVWIYTLVFAFSALWFAHYALAALQAHRVVPAPFPVPPPEALPPLAPLPALPDTPPALPPP